MQKRIIFAISVLIMSIVGSISAFNDIYPNYYKESITSNQLDDSLKNKKNITVFYYKKESENVDNAKEIIFPLSKKYEIPLRTLNVEIQNFKNYNIKGVPTIVHYKDGKEYKRIDGNLGKDKYVRFFKDITKDNKNKGWFRNVRK